MKMSYGDSTVRYILIHHEALAAFLCEQGVSEEKIKQLVIRIRPLVPKSDASEECREDSTVGVSCKKSVVICTWRDPKNAHELNSTFFHETFHFMTKGKYGPDNPAKAYWQRPSEIAARTCAETHKHRIFLSLVGTQQAVPPTRPSAADSPANTAANRTVITPFVSILLLLCCLLRLSLWFQPQEVQR